MTSIRPAAVAGAFYPADPEVLAGTVGRLLEAALPPQLMVTPRMLIVPHAGYVYSGPVAATAYAALGGIDVESVLLMGPCHFAGFGGLAVPAADGFSTPLGAVPIDAGLREEATTFAAVMAKPHRREHSLEVQMPFLQTVAPGAPCLPVLTGDDDPATGAALLDRVLEHPALAAVVSSDLSHYLDRATARRIDAATAHAIVALRPDDLGPGSACGRTAVRAALSAAVRRGWRCQQLDLRSSGDTAGDHSRVVGYGAFALGPAV